MFAPRFLQPDSTPARNLNRLLNILPQKAIEQVVYLYTARAQEIFHDFVTEVYWIAYEGGRSSIESEEIRNFIENALIEGKMRKHWEESTIKRVSGYLGGCCLDFGLVTRKPPSSYMIKSFSTRVPVGVVADNNWKEYWAVRFENILEDAETFKVNNLNEIIEIGAKAKNISDVQSQYIGLIKLSDTGKKIFIEEYASSSTQMINNKKRENAYMTDFLQELILRGHSINAITVNSPWIEIDSADDLHLHSTIKRLRAIQNNL
jgi:hypothetical protein